MHRSHDLCVCAGGYWPRDWPPTAGARDSQISAQYEPLQWEYGAGSVLVRCLSAEVESTPHSHLALRQHFLPSLSHISEPTWLRSPHVGCDRGEVIKNGGH